MPPVPCPPMPGIPPIIPPIIPGAWAVLRSAPGLWISAGCTTTKPCWPSKRICQLSPWSAKCIPGKYEASETAACTFTMSEVLHAIAASGSA